MNPTKVTVVRSEPRFCREQQSPRHPGGPPCAFDSTSSLTRSAREGEDDAHDGAGADGRGQLDHPALGDDEGTDDRQAEP